MEKKSAAKRFARGIITTACVPWTADYAFDEDMFREEIRHILAGGVGHIYLFGTAGEGYALTNGQFTAIVRAFMDEMRPPGPQPMVGVIGTALAQVLERIAIAYGLGAREFQISLPSWGALNDRELMTFFHAVCDAHPDCWFMHYNLGRSGRILGIREYCLLASEIPNLAAAKITTKDNAMIQDLIGTPCPVQFYLSDLGYAYGSLVGECSYLVSLPAINLAVARRYFEAGVNRDIDTLFRIEGEIAAVRRKVMELVGTTAIDGVYDKLGAKLALPNFPLRLLPPYESATEEVFVRYREFFRANFPHWINK